MFALIMNAISTNPWYGPVWLGAIADVFIIASVVYLIVSLKSWKSFALRPPKESGNYLVTTLIHYVDKLNDIYLKEVKTAFYSAFDDEWFVRENECCMPGEVIAWKKLPKPY